MKIDKRNILNKVKEFKGLFWKNIKKHFGIFLIVIVLILLIDLISIISPSFSDFWVKYVETSRITLAGKILDNFSFSIGIIFMNYWWILVSLSLVIFAVVVFVTRKFMATCLVFLKMLVGIGIIVLFVLSSSYLIPMNKTSISQKNNWIGEEYSEKELYTYGEFLLNKINELYPKLNRDENGYLKLPNQMEEEAILSLKNLSSDYPELKGYYLRVKDEGSLNMVTGGFLDQGQVAGVYMDIGEIAMENNLAIQSPEVLCHEYAHSKGFSREEEADFIAYLACINSDNIYFQYSGYLLEYTSIRTALSGLQSEYYSPLVDAEKYDFFKDLYPVTSEDNENNQASLTRKQWDQEVEDAWVQLKNIEKKEHQGEIFFCVYNNNSDKVYDSLDKFENIQFNESWRIYIQTGDYGSFVDDFAEVKEYIKENKTTGYDIFFCVQDSKKYEEQEIELKSIQKDFWEKGVMLAIGTNDLTQNQEDSSEENLEDLSAAYLKVERNNWFIHTFLIDAQYDYERDIPLVLSYYHGEYK